MHLTPRLCNASDVGFRVLSGLPGVYVNPYPAIFARSDPGRTKRRATSGTFATYDLRVIPIELIFQRKMRG